MIDRSSRNIAFTHISMLSMGKIGGFECENMLMDLPDDDNIIEAIRRTVSAIIDERDRPMGSVFFRNGEILDRFSRWLLFLKSDSEYMWPVTKLPAGILDYYHSTFFDKITGVDKRTRQEINEFTKSGDYNYWPFISKADFEREANEIP